MFAQRFDVNGNVLGGEIQVNTTTSSDQRDPAIAELEGGGFVVTWEASNQDGDGRGVFAQRFDSDGAKLGGEVQVNTTTAENQEDPSVIGLVGGGYVVTWESLDQDGDEDGVFARRFDADGNAAGGEFQVNTTTDEDQDDPSIAALSDGGFAIAWESLDQDGDEDGVFVRRFDSSGTAVGGEIQVNTTTSNDQREPSIAGTSDGGFIVTWESRNQDGSGDGVFAQRFDSGGTAVGSEFQVNTTTSSDQDEPAIAVGGATTLTNESLTLLIDLNGNSFTIENQAVTARSLGLEQIDLSDNPDAALAIIDDAIVYASRKAAVLGSNVRRLDVQGDFTTELRDILRARISALVDADLSQEAAKLAAEQIRLGLSISAFNIANASVKSIQLQLLERAKAEIIG